MVFFKNLAQASQETKKGFSGRKNQMALGWFLADFGETPVDGPFLVFPLFSAGPLE